MTQSTESLGIDIEERVLKETTAAMQDMKEPLKTGEISEHCETIRNNQLKEISTVIYDSLLKILAGAQSGNGSGDGGGENEDDGESKQQQSSSSSS